MPLSRHLWPMAVPLVVVAACGGAGAQESVTVNAAANKVRASASVVTCPPSSVRQHTVCSRQTLPPGDGSSPEGCKSDADCTAKSDGRCIRNGYGAGVPQGLGHVHRSNWLGEAPAPPPRSICVYDDCHNDDDCGPKGRCTCGSGQGPFRNGCASLDGCVSDRDCDADALCECGGGAGSANWCKTGNCRTDADCDHGFACDKTAPFCHSSRDTCQATQDCKRSPDKAELCTYQIASHAWACTAIPEIPPG